VVWDSREGEGKAREGKAREGKEGKARKGRQGREGKERGRKGKKAKEREDKNGNKRKRNNKDRTTNYLIQSSQNAMRQVHTGTHEDRTQPPCRHFAFSGTLPLFQATTHGNRMGEWRLGRILQPTQTTRAQQTYSDQLILSRMIGWEISIYCLHMYATCKPFVVRDRVKNFANKASKSSQFSELLIRQRFIRSIHFRNESGYAINIPSLEMAILHVIVNTLLGDSLNTGSKLYQIGRSVNYSLSVPLSKQKWTKTQRNLHETLEIIEKLWV
jgi:hypothetical protein